MKKFIAIITGISLSVFAFSATLFTTPVFADTPCTCANGDSGTKPDTAILGNSACDCGHGESIIGILSLIVNIMTIGIGILGVIGISVVGIQYPTAGGNEEKTHKAKRRMFEIVIGLAAYVVIYALLNWLIPDFKPLGA